MKFDELCSMLEKEGFIRTAVCEGTKKIYRDKDFTLFIEVSEKIDQLTAAEEEAVKRRLRELGYLDEDE